MQLNVQGLFPVEDCRLISNEIPISPELVSFVTMPAFALQASLVFFFSSNLRLVFYPYTIKKVTGYLCAIKKFKNTCVP